MSMKKEFRLGILALLCAGALFFIISPMSPLNSGIITIIALIVAGLGVAMFGIGFVSRQ
jgi:hypothetical protein